MRIDFFGHYDDRLESRQNKMTINKNLGGGDNSKERVWQKGVKVVVIAKRRGC